MKKIFKMLLVLCSIVILIGIGFLINQRSEKALAGLSQKVRDIIGTRVGTSTTPVWFSTPAATSTYRSDIGGDVDTAIYSIGVVNASTTGANVTVSILGSQDSNCNTSSTTGGTLNLATTKDIYWFDASNHIVNIVGNKSVISVATSTLVWNVDGGGKMKEIILTELGVQCLALQINASSTSIWAQLRTKEK